MQGRMESRSMSMNHHLMQRTATLAREVLERAKTRKLNWPLPGKFQRKTFREGDHASLEAAFASVAEHMGHISEECENYYCCVPPFQFKEYEVAHVFRYHSRQASENLLKAFGDEERKACPVVEEPACTDTETFTLIPVDSAELLPAETSNQKAKARPTEICWTCLKALKDRNGDICIEVSPGTYAVSASSHEEKIRQTHLVKVQPGESINLTFDL